MKRILLNESGTFYKINIVFCAELSAPKCPRRIVLRRIVREPIALETLITNILLGSLFKRVDIAPYSSSGTRYAKELLHCRSTFYLEFYQNECQINSGATRTILLLL